MDGLVGDVSLDCSKSVAPRSDAMLSGSLAGETSNFGVDGVTMNGSLLYSDSQLSKTPALANHSTQSSAIFFEQNSSDIIAVSIAPAGGSSLVSPSLPSTSDAILTSFATTANQVFSSYSRDDRIDAGGSQQVSTSDDQINKTVEQKKRTQRKRKCSGKPSISGAQSTDCGTSAKSDKKKNRGSWPKGRPRRLKDVDLKQQPPRAPITAYIQFAKIRRSQLLASAESPGSFPEIAAIIGREWSGMNNEEKKPFIQEAAADMERYKQELRQFESSTAYQAFLTAKTTSGQQCTAKLNADQPEKSSACHGEAIDLLRCSLCNKYFTHLHNKAEHLKSKEHQSRLCDTIQHSQSSSIEPTGSHQPHNSFNKLKSDDALNLDDFIAQFVRRNDERELELEMLRERADVLKARKQSLSDSLTEIRKKECQLGQRKHHYAAIKTKAESQLHNLSALFRLVNQQQVYVFRVVHSS